MLVKGVGVVVLSPRGGLVPIVCNVIIGLEVRMDIVPGEGLVGEGVVFTIGDSVECTCSWLQTWPILRWRE